MFSEIKEKWRKLRCWWKHDWKLIPIDQEKYPDSSGYFTREVVPGSHVYSRKCIREGCGLHQDVSICDMGPFFGKTHFLDREWIEK